ncbi:Gldg family protein [Planctomicrobium sp. SH664]|uniref:Gldg family protein n=1 Tax=Planctomicrobium sp. SH664 TaxID=3448125 RepID=UPI003F5CAF76
MRSHVVLAVFKRNVASYFSGILGYLFIVVFVVAGAFLAFDDQFFANNLANLDRLSESFPLLLLFIIPAITMTAWSDERKLGTDELLFTLPATDFEVLLGKYLAVLAVYTIALAFSITHVFVLLRLGSPDLGLICTTYFGYWLAGAALLSVGMFASVLTSSATVAFVLGTAICAIPVFIDRIPGVDRFLKETLGITEPLSVAGHLKGFTSGLVTYSGLFYFIGLTAFFLYLNAVMIGRRHWAGGRNAGNMTGQYLLRVACLGIALLCLTYSFAVAGGNIDSTSERLHTLSNTTIEIIRKIPDDKPVTIQAFVSPDVPQEYVPIRKELLDKLYEYDDHGGKRIQLRVVDVEPHSQAAEQAESLGIEPRQLQSQSQGRTSVSDVYLGVVMTSGFDTVTIPFFDRGTPIEYELTRSLGTVSQAQRRVVGILKTDAQAFGGMDMQSFRQLPKWQIVQELEKQYEVKEVSPDSPITSEMDVLIAIMPSSLTQPQMEHLVEYVSAGKPALIFDDPAPVWGSNRNASGISMAPLEPKPSPGGGMMPFQQQQSEPKADGGRATSLTEALGIRWDVRKSLFDAFNPHPRFSMFPKELIFLDSRENINPNQPITAGLQELICFAPGAITGRDEDVNVTWLLKSRKGSSGLNDWDRVTQPGFFGGRQYNFETLQRKLTDESYIISALIEGKSDKKKVKAVFVADADLVNDVMFEVWQQQLLDLKIDNVLFVLNCVDYLSGDERFIELRNRRAKHRTLTELERRTKVYESRLSKEVNSAVEAADKEVEEAKARLQTVIKDLRQEMQKGNVDAGTLQARLQNATEAENRKLVQREKEINREKDEKVRKVKNETEQEIRRIERSIWRWAVFIPPLPAILLGIAVIVSRLLNERQGISRDRLR